MDSHGTVPAPVTGSADAPDIAALFDRAGPFVTVYLNTPPDVEQAASQNQARWKAVRKELSQEGAPDNVLDAIDELVADAHTHGRSLAVVADAGGIRLVHHGLDDLHDDRGWWGALPVAVPLIEWHQSTPSHAVVLCDRVGADIAIFAAHQAGESLEQVGDNNTSDPLLRKSKPGGWSQRRYQERAENTWDANMRKVAERLEKIARLVPLRVVIVAGDVRAKQLLGEHLSPNLATSIVEIDGQRAVDGGVDDLSDDIVKMVASAVAEDTVKVLEKFREEKGQDDRAADGVEATLTALTEARVDVLLVHDDPADTRLAWYATDAPLAATDRATLEAQGVAEPHQGRLVDVAVRTAFQTGARVRVVPSTTATDGLGAILRY